MTSKEYENLVMKAFEGKGYTTKVPSRTYDYGVNIIAEKDGKSIAIQVRKYNGREELNYRDVLYLFAGARYFDCNSALVVTDGNAMPLAIEVADKLRVKIFENWMQG